MFSGLYRKGSAIALKATQSYVDKNPGQKTLFMHLVSMQLSALVSQFAHPFMHDDKLSSAKKLGLTLIAVMTDLDRNKALHMFSSSQKSAIQLGKEYGRSSPAYNAMFFISNFMQTLANLPKMPQNISGPEMQNFYASKFFNSKNAQAHIPYSLTLRDWFRGDEEALLVEVN